MTAPLAIYYGWPSSVNGANGNVAKAIAAFAGYSLVVFGGDTVTQAGDPSARQIILGVTAEGGTPYGYISIGVTHGEPGYSLQAIHHYLDLWNALGAKGVLLDCAGADYGVSRHRFDDAVEYAHSLGMHVLANAWDPDDVLAGSTTMGHGDSYLGENDVVDDGTFRNPADYLPKLAKMAEYKKALGISLYETATTRDFGLETSLTARALKILGPYDIDGFQMTDPNYSSSNDVLSRPPAMLSAGT